MNFSSFLHESKLAWRGLWQRKMLSAMMIVPLALGIGATVTTYTVVQEVLLAPLDFPQSDQLISIRHSTTEDTTLRLSPANYLDLVDSNLAGPNGALSSVGAFQRLDVTVVGLGDPITVDAARVSPTFFQVLETMPSLGRPFTEDMTRVPEPAETILDHGAYTILSNTLWRTRFGARQTVIGETLMVNDRPLEIVGVMPEGFDFPAEVEVFLPLGFGEIAARDRGGYYLETLARLADGATLKAADAEAAVFAQTLRELAPRSNSDIGLRLLSLKEHLVEDLDLGLWLLFGISALILLLVAANSAQLFMARGLERHQDVAVRLALGAGRGDIAKRFLAESLTLALVATVLGLLTAWSLLGFLLAASPPELFAGRTISLDLDSLIFSVLLGLIAGGIVGAAPSIYLSRPGSLPRRLTEGGRAQSVGRGQRWIQDGMLIAQLALVVILVHTTYMMLDSYSKLRAVPLGFSPEGVVAVNLTLPWERYPDDPSLRLFSDRVVSEISALPSVTSAGLGLRLPVVDAPGGVWFHLDGADQEESHPATFHAVDPGYLSSLKVPILRGRGIDESDHAEGAPVVVVSRTLAEQFFPDRDPIGQTLILTPWPDLRHTIVGLTADLPQGGLKRETEPAIFVPFAQIPMDRIRLLARVQGDPETAIASLRQAVWNVDPNLGIQSIGTLESELETTMLPDRFSTVLLGIYGFFGVLLVASGIFGVVSFFVESRRAEIGIRSALGGSPGSLVVWVLRHGAKRAAAGTALGVAGALAVAYRISKDLFQVDPWSFEPFLFSLLSLSLVITAAHYWPARRAVRTDPAIVLRPK